MGGCKSVCAANNHNTPPERNTIRYPVGNKREKAQNTTSTPTSTATTTSSTTTIPAITTTGFNNGTDQGHSQDNRQYIPREDHASDTNAIKKTSEEEGVVVVETNRPNTTSTIPLSSSSPSSGMATTTPATTTTTNNGATKEITMSHTNSNGDKNNNSSMSPTATAMIAKKKDGSNSIVYSTEPSMESSLRGSINTRVMHPVSFTSSPAEATMVVTPYTQGGMMTTAIPGNAVGVGGGGDVGVVMMTTAQKPEYYTNVPYVQVIAPATAVGVGAGAGAGAGTTATVYSAASDRHRFFNRRNLNSDMIHSSSNTLESPENSVKHWERRGSDRTDSGTVFHENETDSEEDTMYSNSGSKLLRLRSFQKWDDARLEEHEKELRQQMTYLQQQSSASDIHG